MCVCGKRLSFGRTMSLPHGVVVQGGSMRVSIICGIFIRVEDRKPIWSKEKKGKKRVKPSGHKICTHADNANYGDIIPAKAHRVIYIYPHPHFFFFSKAFSTLLTFLSRFYFCHSFFFLLFFPFFSQATCLKAIQISEGP